jgi:hypothetical protein
VQITLDGKPKRAAGGGEFSTEHVTEFRQPEPKTIISEAEGQIDVRAVDLVQPPGGDAVRRD